MALLLVVMEVGADGKNETVFMSQDRRVIDATLAEIARLVHDGQTSAPDDDIFRRLGLRPDGE